MDIILQIILLVVGFVLLVKGADWLIDGASSTAAHFKVSKMLIGLTIVAFGTGAPEFAVSISSFLTNNTDVLLGNVVGSNILNILLLIGIGALIRPIRIKKDTIKKELPMLLLITVIFVALFLDMLLSGATENLITRTDGIICVLLFALFLFHIISMAHRNHSQKSEIKSTAKTTKTIKTVKTTKTAAKSIKPKSLAKSTKTKPVKNDNAPKFNLGFSILITIIGLIGVVGGSELVVNSASTIAAAIGISERIIALTVVALGTSLPELVTTITAAKRGETELLVGNIIGSNIFNICIVLGLPVLIFGGINAENFNIVDPIAMIVSVVLLYIVSATHRKITRPEGALMLATFVAYYGYIIYAAIT